MELKQPKPMQLTGNVANNWDKFKNTYHLYITATEASNKSKEVRAAILLHCIGEETREILEVLETTEAQKKDPDAIIYILNSHFKPKTNKSIERHKFNCRKQAEAETFDTFVEDLRRIAGHCEFGILKEDLITDRIICGIRDPKTKDRLLREENLNLKRAIDICTAAEQSNTHIKQLGRENHRIEVATINKNTTTGTGKYQQRDNGDKVNQSRHNSASGRKFWQQRGADSGNAQGQRVWPTQQEKSGNQNNCGRCGKIHPWVQCKPQVLQQGSILFTFFIIPWSNTMFTESFYKMQYMEVPLKTKIIYYSAVFCLTIARFTSIAEALAFWPVVTAAMVLIHFTVVVTWFWWCTKSWEFFNYNELWNIFLPLVFGWVHIFIPIIFIIGPIRKQYIWFYGITFVQNTAPSVLWFVGENERALEYKIAVICLNFLTFVFGLGLINLYFKKCLPNKLTLDEGCDREDLLEVHAD